MYQKINEPVLPLDVDSKMKLLFKENQEYALANYPHDPHDPTFHEIRKLPLVFDTSSAISPITREGDIVRLALKILEWPGVRDYWKLVSYRHVFTVDERNLFDKILIVSGVEFQQLGHHAFNLNIAIVLGRAIASEVVNAGSDLELLTFVGDRMAKSSSALLGVGDVKITKLSDVWLLISDYFRGFPEEVLSYREISARRPEQKVDLGDDDWPQPEGFLYAHMIWQYGLVNRDSSLVDCISVALKDLAYRSGEITADGVLAALQGRLRKHSSLQKLMVDDLLTEAGGRV